MITVEKLKQYGADTKAGLGRCMNNESFYLRMIDMAIADKSFDKFAEAVAADDLKAAFEAAHALKGVAGNLGLDPIFKPVSEATELLRAGTKIDYSNYVKTLLEQREILVSMKEKD